MKIANNDDSLNSAQRRLEDVGFNAEQARIIAEAIQARRSDAVTRDELRSSLVRVERRVAVLLALAFGVSLIILLLVQ